MKKFLLITIILLLTTACSGSYLKRIDYKGLKERIDNKETFAFAILDESDMSKTLKNTISKVAKDNKITFYYLETEKLKTDDSKNLKELFTYDEENIIIFVKKGIENSTLGRVTDPFISQSDLKEELQNQGFIK